MTSLRRRLVVTLLASVLLGGLVGVVGLYWQAIEEFDELFDDRLQDIGDNLTPQMLSSREQPTQEESEDDIVIQLWDRAGQLRYTSRPKEPAPAPTASGLANHTGDSKDWRSYSRSTADGGLLQVAQEVEARQDIALESTARLLLPLLIILPLVALFASWAISRLLRPLRSLAEQLQRSGPQQQARVQVDDVPRELVPVIGALNDLLARQAEAARKQQAFLADAAHELRTPLTVVGLQLQRAQQASDAQEQAEALDGLKSGVERATRLVTQLLALARSEPDREKPLQKVSLNFESLLKTVLAELYPLAAHKQIDLGLVDSQPCMIESDGEDLRSLITNLVDNAIRHTPAGGRVDVSLQVRGALATLRVSDTGCGIAAERRQAVFERFVRDGSADSSGTGLGLAIVRQVVERHGGRIALEDGANGVGLVVRIELPMLSLKA